MGSLDMLKQDFPFVKRLHKVLRSLVRRVDELYRVGDVLINEGFR
jgi:hypothetical protein